MKYLSLKEAKQVTGISGNTLRKYADNGTIPHFRLPNGDRRFDVSAFIQQRRTVVCYARVSTREQTEDLQHQLEILKLHQPEAEVVTDFSSGLSFKRKGLKALLERALCGESLTVVITHRDRLVRFGFDLVEGLFKRSGGSVMVLNHNSTSPVEELTRDLTAINRAFGRGRSNAGEEDIA
jgi:predicted site-specific integrase-resolvase